jgi:hypothetical protein
LQPTNPAAIARVNVEVSSRFVSIMSFAPPAACRALLHSANRLGSLSENPEKVRFLLIGQSGGPA